MTLDEAALQQALPPPGGTLHRSGLGAPTTVHCDEWGIPLARAQTSDDAHFALGFVHAQGRRFQMDLTCRRGPRGAIACSTSGATSISESRS